MIQDVILGDCLAEMKKFPDNYIDLVVTSPPYDNLRTYNGNLDWNFEIFQDIAKELFRIIKVGGVIVWVVGDATQNGSETGTSFKQALYFKEVGFNLHDTMIYSKKNPIPLTHNRYEQQFEYMFIFSKEKPKTFNPILEECKTSGRIQSKRTFWQKPEDTERKLANTQQPVKNTKYRYNIWNYSVGVTKGKGHPAPFPDELASDHILSWSNENDIVLDPFAGSGTVGKMAKQLNRQFILIEKEEKYYNIIKERLNA